MTSDSVKQQLIARYNVPGPRYTSYPTVPYWKTEQWDSTEWISTIRKNRGVYCVNHGKVKIYAIGDEGKEQIIHIAKEGEVIGFRAMFSGDPYKVSATSLEDGHICFISKDNFLDMIDSNAALRNMVMKELSRELGDRAQFITNLAQKSVRERLAFTLLLLQNVYGEEPINLSREDMANFVGTATETLIRLLKDFKEEGLIEVQTRKLTILDREGLIRLGGPIK